MAKKKKPTSIAGSKRDMGLGPSALKKPVKATYKGCEVLIVARDAKLGTVTLQIGNRIKPVRAIHVQELK